MAALLATFMLLVAACGSEPIPISAPANGATASQTQAVAASPIAIGASDFGDILVDGAGSSLYGFTNDSDGVSTCEGGCASAWPPLLVESDTLPAGLDATIFSVITRSDGTSQLKAGTWPLYLFAGDTGPGQTTGHLSGDVWFLAAPDGSLIGVEPTTPANEAAAVENAATAQPTLASAASSSLGEILVSGAGLTLYGFTNDVAGLPTCEGGCAEAWPPILVSGGQLPADLNPAIFSVVARGDGKSQLKAGKWPLYLFAGDTAPGQTTGHLSGDVWFAAAPDGSLIGAGAPEQADPAPAEVESPYGERTDQAQPVAVGIAQTEFGDILVDSASRSLDGFGNDFEGRASTCLDGCADAWPPVLVDSVALPAGLDTELFSIVTRPDGTYQLKSGIWPLYRFGGDTGSGQTTGHLSGGVWFLASPDGKLIGFVPPAPPAPTPVVSPAPTSAPAQPAATATREPEQPMPTAPSYDTSYDSSDDGY